MKNDRLPLKIILLKILLFNRFMDFVVKHKLFRIPNRCPQCDNNLWGKICNNKDCDVKYVINWCGKDIITRI